MTLPSLLWARFALNAGEEKVRVATVHWLLVLAHNNIIINHHVAEPYALLSQRCEVSQIILLLLLQVS